jgi:hypothetical protein
MRDRDRAPKRAANRHLLQIPARRRHEGPP